MKNLIRKNKIEMIFSLAAMLVQTPHSAWFFSKLSHLQDERLVTAHGILFALLFDFGIVYYVLKANKKVVFLFTVFSIFMNFGYYFADGIPATVTVMTIAPIVLSCILPLMIYFFTEEIPRAAHIEVVDNSRSAEALDMIANGSTYDEICKKLKISKSTLTKWVKENKQPIPSYA